MQLDLSGLAALIAMLGSTAAALLSIEQLLLPSRLRRVADWAYSTAEKESNPHKQASIRKVAERATARLIGADQVPAYSMAEAPLWSLFVAWFCGLVVWRGWPVFTTVALLFFALTATAVAARRFVRLYVERQRVAASFLRGDPRIPPAQIGILAQMEGGTKAEFTVGVAYATGLVLVSAGVGATARTVEALWFCLVLPGLALLDGVRSWLARRGLARDL